MVQKLTTYEHYHPELYQEKFKCHVNMAKQMILMILAGNKKWLWQSGPGGKPRPVQVGQTEGACEGL